MPVGEGEDLRLAERRRREPAALALVDHGRVEALLDRRPDRERRREVVAVDDEVGTVADADLVDPREEVVGGIAGGDVGEAGLDAHAHERHQVAVLPRRVLRELGVAEPAPGLLVGLGRMRLGHVHRHVDVVAVGGERAFEDRWVEARVAGVEDHVGAALHGERGDAVLVAGVDIGGLDPPALGVDRGRDRLLGALDVDVGDRDVVVGLPVRCDRHERRSDPARTDHEYSHALAR